VRLVCAFILAAAVSIAAENDTAPPESGPTALAAKLRGESSLDLTRTTLEKWVEVRQQIGRTQTDWEADRETLHQMSALLGRELQVVGEQAAKLSTNSVQVEKERLQAEESLQAANEHLEKVRQFAANFEGQIPQLIPRLPAPLQDLLKPWLNRLPADPASTKMTAAERIQVIVAILNELDKFNNGLTIASEKRRNDQGEEVAVETIYVGLGTAYFVNDAGDFAGLGSPGAGGWEWTARPALAATVREVIRIYRNERPARFVSLPATIR